MKDLLSNFDIAAITSELRKKIIDEYIDNVYHLNSKTLLFRLKPGPLYLILEAGRRVHVTKYLLKTPPKPIQFCMVLRKHILRGRIVRIEQPEFERIIELVIDSKGQSYRLIIETFKRGNIILVGQDGKIVAALKLTVMKDRKILIREEFKPAPSEKISLTKIVRKDLEQLKEYGEAKFERALTNSVAIDGLYTKELLLRTQIDGTMKANELSNEQIKDIYRAIEGLREKIIKESYEPSIILDSQGNPIDIVPFPLNVYDGFNIESFESFNKAADEYFSNVVSDREKQEISEELSKQNEELQRILNRQLEQKSAFKKAIDINRKKGELIYQHINEIEHLSQLIRSRKKDSHSWKDIGSMIKQAANEGKKPELYFQKIIPEKLEYVVKIDDLDLHIDLKQKPQQIASILYNKAKKSEAKLVGLKKSTDNIQEKLKNIKVENLQTMKELPELVKRREKAWYEKFRWFKSKNFLILCGRDASNNELLIKRHMEPLDIILHAEIHGAPFAIIKTEGKEVRDKIIEEAAQFAISYSKAWGSNISTVDAYWVKPDQVSKMPPSGQYLNKGMFMIRGKRNYMKGILLKLAIGALRFDEQTIIISSGPPSVLEDTALAYVEISPGKTPSGKLAKKIKTILVSKIPEKYRATVKRIDLTEIQRLIPSGKADIT